MGWGPLADSAGVMLPWGLVGCDFLGLREGGWGWLAEGPGLNVVAVYGERLGALVL